MSLRRNYENGLQGNVPVDFAKYTYITFLIYIYIYILYIYTILLKYYIYNIIYKNRYIIIIYI